MSRRYESIGTYKTNVGKVIYLPTRYPSLAPSNNDYYIIARAEDRLDLVATDFFGDPTLWWVVAMANDLPGDSMFPPMGFQLRIPGNLSDALQAYEIDNADN
jgi:hypothetical protein|tara:strand:- start:2571 stop:2876 length:306 start_codon:yes stop_codon:yes gene_type:complete